MAGSDNRKNRQGKHGAGTRLAGVLLAATLIFGLTACGSKPVTRTAETGATGSKTAQTTGVLSRRGGGFYLDDGPDDVPPEGLDRIPDALPRIEPFHQPGFRPYTALNQRFVPRTSLTQFRERGHASWYGRRFHGNPTSTGEPYDMYAMSAAHPTLPIPSYARVTNLGNGRQVIVRINDRGPFLRGRVIDLSYAAAHRLGYINAGSAMVEVESITHEDIQVAQARGVPARPGMSADAGSVVAAAAPVMPMPFVEAERPKAQTLASLDQNSLPKLPQMAGPTAALPAMELALTESAAVGIDRGAYLQLAAFSSSDNANQLANRVRSELGVFADRLHLLMEAGRYRLQLGPFASADDARTEAQRLGALLNIQPFVVIR